VPVYTYTTIDDPLAAFTPPGGGSFAQGINDAGQIVGYYMDNGGRGFYGFLYSGGIYTTIDDDPLANAGFGSFNGLGSSGMILRNFITGAFEVYDIANNQITAAANLGQVGPDWQVAGFGAVDSPSASMGNSNHVSQLVQAMAGLDGSGAADGLSTVQLGAETSQQTFLTAPHA
jgi:hypothetical protein